MTAAAWALYALLLILGLAWTGMGAAERAYERITLPQMLYFVYLLALALWSARILASVPLACAFLALPMLFTAWWTWGEAGRDDAKLRDEWQGRLDKIRSLLEEDATAVLPLDALGDLYVQLGEPGPAKRAYARLEVIYEGKTGFGRFLTETRGKLERLRIGGASCAADPRLPKLLRACKTCESVVLRAAAACPSCGAAQYPGDWTRRAALTAHWLERRNLTRVAAVGLLFVPFHRVCGPAPYALLWAVWIAALATSRNEPALLGEDTPRAVRLVAAQGALLGAIALAFAVAPAPRARAARGNAPETASAISPSGEIRGIGAVRSVDDVVREAKAISAQAGARAERLRRENAEAGAPDGPASELIPRLIADLGSPHEGERLEAAQLLSDLRYAANAGEAAPLLEKLVVSDPSEDVRGASALALQRVRYCASDAACAAKWKTR